jgi:hypothetical protein
MLKLQLMKINWRAITKKNRREAKEPLFENSRETKPEMTDHDQKGKPHTTPDVQRF